MSVSCNSANKSTLKSGRRSRFFSLRFFAVAACAAVLLCGLSFLFAKTLFPMKYSAEVDAAAAEFGLSRAEVYAVIMAESGFDPTAESTAGAKGLMQLMPSTAKFCAALVGAQFDESDIFDAGVNVRLGCRYLVYLKQRFDGDYVYAAYNAGEGKVRLWLNENIDGFPIRETADYVKRVKLYKKIYSFLYGL
ncbi:MAG: lytic transglycosylase domain-containing protein [Clostridia bacterium]|nr:lytic transglycosylase domain-containing protein [Clostridia bacterium]